MKYLLNIAYDGTLYKGWQSQKNKPTIQGILEKQLRILLKEEITLYAAGRTDAGVHAKSQFTHFETTKSLNIPKIHYNLNCLLKHETIVILSIKPVSDDFHARFSCIMKEYQYQILVGHIKNIFLSNRYWLVPKFNINIAQQCADLICGTHDFSSFRDSQCQALSPMKTIKECVFSMSDNLITMKIQAKSFLHHQIRIIIGTIFEIAAKEKNPRTIEEILIKKDRKFAGITAPAKGLFLSNVIY